MSDSLKPRELIQLAHQLFLLISTRPAFIARLTEQQSSAISWVVENFDEPNTNALSTSSLSSSSISVEKQSLIIVVPLSWLNNYDRPLKAADRVLTGLPLLQALVNTKVSLPLKSSPLPQSYSPEILSRPSLPNPNKIMGDEIVPAPTTTTLTSDQFNQLLQAIGQPSRNCKAIDNSQFRPQELGFFNPKNEAEKLVECLDNMLCYHVFDTISLYHVANLVTFDLFAHLYVSVE